MRLSILYNITRYVEGFGFLGHLAVASVVVGLFGWLGGVVAGMLIKER